MNKDDAKEKELPNGRKIFVWICGVTGKEFTDTDGFCAMMGGISKTTVQNLKKAKNLPYCQAVRNQKMRFYMEDVTRWLNLRRAAV